MHFHIKSGFDAVDLQLLAIIAIVVTLGCAIYLLGDIYEMGTQAERVARAVPAF